MAKKLFDCFIFYNELELLEIRLRELYNKVDYFVLCEATSTFQGKPKPLFFDMHKEKFAAFADKIVHLVVRDMPINDGSGEAVGAGDDSAVWGREHFQRNALRRGLAMAEPGDVIIISDIDEIIAARAADYLRSNDGYFTLDMPMYQFFLNMRAMEAGWRKPFAYSYALDPEIPDYNVVRTNELQWFQKFNGRNHYVKQAGWHFTFLGGPERVRNKLTAYSHTDGWQRQMSNDRLLNEQMIALREVGGHKTLVFCQLDDSFPEIIRNNADRYQSIGFVKDQWTRLKELEILWSAADGQRQEIGRAYDQAVKNLAAMQRAVSEAGIGVEAFINIIPNSRDFSAAWSRGMQTAAPEIEKTIAPLLQGNDVLVHHRMPRALIADANVGCFSGLPVQAGTKYTASCYVWLPKDFSGEAVSISIDNWPGQSQYIARIHLLDQWQRIYATCTSPLDHAGCNVVLRVHADTQCRIYSTCWQLEEGDAPTKYRATGAVG